MRRRIALFFLLLIFLAGCLISLFPVINGLLYREKMKTTVSEFQSNTEQQLPPVIIRPSGDSDPTEYTPAIHQELWNDIPYSHAKEHNANEQEERIWLQVT